MLSVSDLSVAYGPRGRRVRVLDRLSVEFGPCTYAVTGPSGSGKSTLLRALSGLQRPDSGSVTLDGRAVEHSRSGTVDPRVSVVYQDFRLIDFLTVEQNLRAALSLRAVPYDSADLSRVLDLVGLDGKQRRRPAELSGGEQQRVSIARAVLLRSRVLLADEPTGALDPENSENIALLFRDLVKQEARTVIVATHDPAVSQVMDAQLALYDGRLLTR